MSDTGAWGHDGREDRLSRKRDRLARLLSVASILYARGSGDSGVPATEIAGPTGMTTRPVHPAMQSLEEGLAWPLFQSG